MAKRFTDTELWDKEWFMKLPCKLKCLVKFVRDKSDLSGVWSPNWIIANAYIGEPVNENDLLNIDNGNQFKKIANNKIFCIGFVDFQYGSELSEKSPVHRKIISLLQQHGIYENYQKIEYKYPINRVQDKDKEEDKEKEKVKVKEKEHKNQKILFKESYYFDIEKLKSELEYLKPPYCLANAEYYHNAMDLWSRENNQKKVDWLATCQNWILRDFKEGKLIDKNYKVKQHGINGAKTAYTNGATPFDNWSNGNGNK